jgi:hypothetical protein
MKTIIPVALILLISLSVFVYASDFSGDGTHTIEKEDNITLDNGWKIEVLDIFMAHYGEQISFRYYDPEGKAYPSKVHKVFLDKIDGKEKYGTDTTLKIEIEVLEVSGEQTSTGSPIVSAYEKATISVASIDEALPGAVADTGDELTEAIEKEFAYKHAVSASIGIGEERVLGNGYRLILDSFNQRYGTPMFSLYDSEGNMIDEGIGMGNKTSGTFGSFIYIDEYDGSSVKLKIIDGSKLTFGTGWNLFSIHLEDGDGYGTVLESTCNNATLWIWDNEIEDYEKIGVLEEGAKIPAGKGVWAKIQTKPDTIADIDCEALVSGTKDVTTSGMKLEKGWNMIGAPISAYGRRERVESGTTFHFLNFEDILGDCEIEKGPWQFLGTKYSHFNIRAEAAEQHKFSEPHQNNLRLNRGYFIKVKDDCALGDI